ncbi:MAG: NAD(P)/FAD-dependent oxidoreductase [Eubacteriales bacterium]|nr:NAD(P)/FAD-dependent oxidoreductase [Eubacteriales bacterium]
MYDVAIIGAGVTGCAIARELSRWALDILVLEREEDVCCGTSKANSAIIHAGYDAKPGSRKARFNVEGNAMMDTLARELDFPFVRNGSLVLCFDEAQLPKLQALAERGRQNGVPGLRIVTGPEMKALEPALSDQVKALLYCPTGGIVCPFLMTVALAENAFVNGAGFRFHTTVTGLSPCTEQTGWQLVTKEGERFEARCVVNAAGVYADAIHNLVCPDRLSITPRRGEYQLLDKKAGNLVSHTLFQLPGKMGKGVLVTPTVHGNLLVGPTAENLSDKEAVNTTAEGLSEVMEKGSLSVPSLPYNMTITSFAGLRASEAGGDFVIGEANGAPGFFDCAGIESPGLSSAPAIGRYLAEQIAARLGAAPRENFQPCRKGIPCVAQASPEQLRALLSEDASYGTVVCRCETVTEGEIRNAIRRPLGARSLDGVKRRVRAGMGRCQAGFCSPRVMELLEQELGLDPLSVSKHGKGSELLAGRTREENP